MQEAGIEPPFLYLRSDAAFTLIYFATRLFHARYRDVPRDNFPESGAAQHGTLSLIHI